jgi:DNA-binding NarL/FixJ family response regulator
MTRGYILIVDQDRLAALELQQRVTQVGYTVLTIASSSREALAKAAALLPDAVLIDVHLPGPVDGLQTGTLLWVRFGIPVIYISAHLTTHTFQRLWPTCLAGLLGKNIGVYGLRKALDEIVEARAPTLLDPARWSTWLSPTFSSPPPSTAPGPGAIGSSP